MTKDIIPEAILGHIPCQNAFCTALEHMLVLSTGARAGLKTTGWALPETGRALDALDTIFSRVARENSKLMPKAPEGGVRHEAEAVDGAGLGVYRIGWGDEEQAEAYRLGCRHASAILKAVRGAADRAGSGPIRALEVLNETLQGQVTMAREEHANLRRLIEQEDMAEKAAMAAARAEVPAHA